MAGVLTISATLAGANYADNLEGGGTGADIGTTVTGQYTPLSDQSTNSGQLDMFFSHDGAVDPITDVKLYLGQYGLITGFTYGGANSAAADYAKVLNMGDASTGATANNQDGLNGGLWTDMDWQVSQTVQFNPARPQVKIFGSSGGAAAGQGRSISTAFTMHADAMSRNNGGLENDASAPQAGKIGKSGDTVLGDRAHPRFRLYARANETFSGLLQWELLTGFAFTA